MKMCPFETVDCWTTRDFWIQESLGRGGSALLYPGEAENFILTLGVWLPGLREAKIVSETLFLAVSVRMSLEEINTRIRRQTEEGPSSPM